MLIYGYERIKDALQKHADGRKAIDMWYANASAAHWKNLAEVRAFWPTADAVGTCTVFNVKGNKYRLVTTIDYGEQIISINELLTHAQYDKEKWKRHC